MPLPAFQLSGMTSMVEVNGLGFTVLSLLGIVPLNRQPLKSLPLMRAMNPSLISSSVRVCAGSGAAVKTRPRTSKKKRFMEGSFGKGNGGSQARRGSPRFASAIVTNLCGCREPGYLAWAGVASRDINIRAFPVLKTTPSRIRIRIFKAGPFLVADCCSCWKFRRQTDNRDFSLRRLTTNPRTPRRTRECWPAPPGRPSPACNCCAQPSKPPLSAGRRRNS